LAENGTQTASGHRIGGRRDAGFLSRDGDACGERLTQALAEAR